MLSNSICNKIVRNACHTIPSAIESNIMIKQAFKIGIVQLTSYKARHFWSKFSGLNYNKIIFSSF